MEAFVQIVALTAGAVIITVLLCLGGIFDPIVPWIQFFMTGQ
jgi:hypothetical protein